MKLIYLFFLLWFRVVESVGENVEEVKTGDIVVPVFKRNCGECRDCKSQKGNGCSKFSVEYRCGMPKDGSSRFKDKNGENLYHTLWVSSFTEYTVVDVTHVVKMTPDFPIDKASLLSCGVSTGSFHSVYFKLKKTAIS